MLLAMVMILSCVPMEGLAAIVPVNGPTTSSDGISLFSIVKDPAKTYTYVFMNGTEVVSTQIVKNDESLLDPGTPKSDDVHKEFVGWYTAAEGGTQFTSFGKIEIADDAKPNTITLYARFKTVYFVFFEDGTGRIIHTEKGEPGGKIQTSVGTAAYPLSGEENLTGWKVKGTDDIVDEVMLDSTDIHLTAVVSKGHWITFDSQGGSYVEPLFVANGETGTEPAAPTRPGYTFDHWSKKDGSEYDWTAEVKDSLTLYAVWTANTNTQYTVIHWIENANDDGYSFGASTTGTGTTGTDTSAQALTREQWTAAGIDNNDGRTDRAGFTEQSITQQTIAGDGSTIVSVYYKRNEYSIYFWNDSSGINYTCGKESHKHSWGSKCYNWEGQLTCTKEEHTHTQDCVSTTGGLYTDATITAKYGANISDQWPTVNGSSTWKISQNATKYQVNIDTMPLNGDNFYGPKTGEKSETAYYYVEVLPGETGTEHNGVTYELHHSDTTPGTGYTVTDEDKYPITGFTYKEGTNNGLSYNSAKFYYTRNSYNIVYVSGGKTVNTAYKYEQSIADAGEYKPAAKPEGLSDAHTFEGWYADPECTKKYVFAADAKMPAENITVYAKWAAPVFEGTIYLTIEGTDEPVKVEVPYGGTLEKTLAEKQAKIMEKLGDGYEWHCWKKLDDTVFNPSTQIYENITLKPYYTSTAAFKVSYETGKDDVTASDGKDYAQDSYADIVAPSRLTSGGQTFLGWKVKGDESKTLYQPRQKYLIKGNVTFEAVWGNTPDTVTLTYHSNYQSVAGTTLEEETRTVNDIPNNGTVNAAAGTIFTAPTGYEFGGWAMTATATKADVEAGAAILIDNNGSNDLYAVWTKDTNQKHSIAYKVEYYQDGTLQQTSGPDTDSEWIGTGLTVNFTKSVVAPTGKYGSAYKLDSVKVDDSPVATDTWSVSLTAYEKTVYTADNPYVIKVYYVKNQFQLTIHYQYADGTKAADTHTEDVEVGSTYSVGSPTITGYTPDIATVSGTMPAENVEVTVTYKANDNTAYKVEHYQQNLNDGGYTLKDTENLTGTTGATATATAKTYDGFTFDENNANNVLSGTIAGNGSLVLKLYYTRNSYKVTYKYESDVAGQSNLPEEASYKYGAEVKVAAAATAAGYTFSGWSTADATIASGEFIMPANNVTITGSWSTDDDQTVPVTYKAEGKGEVSPEINNIQIVTAKDLTGSTATAKSGYKFVGWYKGEEKVSDTAELTVAKAKEKLNKDANGNYAATTFVAKFERDFENGGDDDQFKFSVAGCEEMYDGKAYTVTISGLIADEDYVSFSTDGTTWTEPVAWDGTIPENLKYTNVGEYPVYVKAKNGDVESQKNATVKITPRPVTITANSALSIPYDGKAHQAVGEDGKLYTVSGTDGVGGLLEGHTLKNCTIKYFVGKDLTEEDISSVVHIPYDACTYVGVYTAFVNSGIKIMSNGTDVTKNYEITRKTGTLTITGAELIPSKAVSSTAPEGGYNLGDTITFTITVTNLSAEPVKNVFVVDADEIIAQENVVDVEKLADGTYKATILHIGSGPLAENTPVPGNVVTLTVKHVVTEADILAGKYTNTATITGDKEYTVTADVENIEKPNPALTVTKKDGEEEGHEYKLGDTIEYTITVTNTGNLTISNVVVTDQKTGATFDENENDAYTVGTDAAGHSIATLNAALAPNASVTLTAKYTVTEADILNGKGKLVNVATASGKDPNGGDPNVTPGESEDDIEDKKTELSVTKTTTSTPADEELGKYKLGEKITYDIEVKNTGNQTITDIVVTDNLADATIIAGDGYTVEENKAKIASLAPNASVTVKAEYIVTEADVLAGSVKNTATATGDAPDETEPEGNGGTEDETEDKKSHLTVTKTTNNTGSGENGAFELGETIWYTITVTNDGNQTIKIKTIVDELAGSNIQNFLGNSSTTGGTVTFSGDGYELKPGDSLTLNKVSYVVKEADILAGQVVNTATATGTDPEGKAPVVEDGETTDTTVEPNAHFSLEKTLTNLPNKGYFTVGETAEFDVVVTNDGNVTLNLNVFETLKGATFTGYVKFAGYAENEDYAEVDLSGVTVAKITSLAPGKSVTLKAEYTVTAEDLGNKELKNVVTGKGEGPKTDPEKPINPPEDKTEENIPVDDAVIVKITKKWDDEENKYESRPESVSFTLYQSMDKENSAIGKLVVSEETDWTAESGKLPAHTKDGAEITYTLTENEVTGYDWDYTVQLPPSADTNEQLPPQDDQAHEAEVVEQKYTVTNTLRKHKLTIRYWKYAVGGEKVTGDYSAEYAYNAPYSVQSPDLYGWDADMSRVEGRMPDDDLVVDVVYRQLIYKLTIYYIFEDGTTAHKEYEAKLTAGEKFAVESPEIEGYKPNLWMISGEMPARDLNYTVIYMAQNTPVDLSAATAPLGIGNVVPNAGDCFD